MDKKNFKKEDLIKILNKRTGLSCLFLKNLTKDLIDIIILNIKSGSFTLNKVGSFKLIEKNERMGRNPKTSQEFVISSRKSVSFTLSKNISIELNKL